MMTTERQMAQLHSVAGAQQFHYRQWSDSVNIVALDPQNNFKGSNNITKSNARKVWDALVGQGWSTKRIKA